MVAGGAQAELAQVDDSQQLLTQVQAALAAQRKLRITGSGSKAHLVPASGPSEQLLSVAEHRGVETYIPDELVITVRAGTAIADVQRLLERNQQTLAWDPPRLGGRGSIGGAIASGLAGPARPWAGGVRDAVLGVEIINGLGERLRFGGQVMKNVAGYDISRLQAGAWGTLGILLSVSLRVAPVAMADKTLHIPLAKQADPCVVAGELAQRNLPLAGISFDSDVPDYLSVRLAGPPHAVARACELGSAAGSLAADLWSQLRDQTHPIFSSGLSGGGPTVEDAGGSLWRVVLPLGTPALESLLSESAQHPVRTLVEWGGALRWVRTVAPEALVAAVQRAGGHLRRYPDGDPLLGTPEHEFVPRLRQAFDPHQVFNQTVGPHAD